MALSDEQRRRYARHIMLDEIGEAGQEKLSRASVLVIGAGGLGAALLSYLAAGGVGRIGICDGDHVESSNLQRQIIHEEADVGRLKVESAADRVSELNPAVAVDLYPRRITAQNAPSIIARYDIVADGSDNFATRFAINDACIATRKTLVSAAIRGFDGQVATFKPFAGESLPCYRCFVPETPPEANNCTEVGVIGPLAGMIGSLQALEVMKEIIGSGDSLAEKLWRYDALTHETRISKLSADPACPACASLRRKST